MANRSASTSTAAIPVKRSQLVYSVLRVPRSSARLPAKLGEKTIDRRRSWSKRDATAWTTPRLTWHIVGTCVGGDLRILGKVPDRARPLLRALTTCVTPLIAVYHRLSRRSGNFSNKNRLRHASRTSLHRSARFRPLRSCYVGLRRMRVGAVGNSSPVVKSANRTGPE